MKMLRNARLVSVLAAAALASGCGDTAVGVDDFLGCETVQTIEVGATVDGTLDNSDCRLPDNTYTDFYFLSLDFPRTVTITQRSSEIDSYLYVFRQSDAVILDENDNFEATGSDARVVISFPAGRFIIAANSPDVDTGPYTLTVQ